MNNKTIKKTKTTYSSSLEKVMEKADGSIAGGKGKGCVMFLSNQSKIPRYRAGRVA
jgi:hypothetical protein